MKKSILAITVLGVLVIPTLLQAQVMGNVIYNESNLYRMQRSAASATATIRSNTEMEFSVKSLMNVKAESYLAILGMRQHGESAAAADSLMNARYSKFREAAIAMGIPPEDIYLDMISLVPLFDMEVEKKLFSKTYNEVPAGFELQKNIHIGYKDAEILDKLLSAAAAQEIYDLVKVEYFAGNPQENMVAIRKLAIDYLLKKFADFKRLGVDLDTVYRVIAENSAVTYPLDRYLSYQAHSSGHDAYLKVEDGVKLMKRPVTRYYNKLDYQDFDIIINPEFVEPGLQYSYEIKIKFMLRPPEIHQPKPEQRILLITPDGDFRPLP
ncbi:MAG: SIMPL domain-containing protein [Bacteroidia bacterium]